MRFTPALFLALPLLVSAASRPASYFGDRLVVRDDDDDDNKKIDMNEPINDMCSIDLKEPNDCGSGWCCYHYEECMPGKAGQTEPWCLDHSVTTLGVDAVSVPALQFATTGLPSTAAAQPTGDDKDKTTAANEPTNTAAAGAAQSSGAAVQNGVAGALGLGAIAGLAGILF